MCGLEFTCAASATGKVLKIPVALHAATKDANGNMVPGSTLASGTMVVTDQVQAYRAVFTKPVTMLPNTDYFAALQNLGLKLPINTGGTGIVHLYGGPTWRGPYASGLSWNHRLVCCGGSPKLSVTGTPAFGKSFGINLTDARPSATSVLVFGLQKTSVNLSIAGASGCSLYTNPLVLLYRTTSLTGGATVSATMPSDQTLSGLKFYNEWAIFDAEANNLGVAWSEGGEGTIGT